MGLLDDLTDVADDILGVRDTIGAAIQNVFVVERTWTGAEPGDGTYTDVVTQMLPTPALLDPSRAGLSHKYKLAPTGRYKQGDLILKQVSKQSYPDRDVVRLKSTDKSVEKFYRVADELYTVVTLEESYITWNVHVRKVMGR